MSPERSGTPHDEMVFTPKLSVPASPVAGTPLREAQSPISLLLAVAQSQNRQHNDDDLTSLSWLHEGDILKGINFNPSPSNSVNSTPIKNGNNFLSDQSPTSDFVDDSSISAADSSNSSVHSPIPYQNQSNLSIQQRNKHPHNIPYDPLIHTNNKPPYSFSCLIFMAIEDSVQKALPVKEIYAWILDHFPYFRNAPTGWKNSVRHNLSLNKCFQKVEKAPNLGKGSLWTVDPQYKPNLIQALTRSPFHPCSTLDPSVYFNTTAKTSITSEKTTINRLPNPELFPYLARKLAATSEVSVDANKLDGTVKIAKVVKPDSLEDSLDAVDAAAVMLSLKNGPKYRQRREKGIWQIITTSPSQDHTYSAAESGGEVVDEAFESEEERVPKPSTCRKIDFEDDEARRIKEGAETLLNLAGITPRKRYNSQNGDYSADKRIKMSPRYDINKNEPEEKIIPFKPRLLRPKKKECKSKVVFNNNNNDEWVKHRRELEINQYR